jgi:hypothetical protein
MTGNFSLEPVIDGTRQFLSYKSEGFALAVCFLQSGQEFLPGGMISQEEDSRFRKGPRAMGLADCGA